jgi:hypothetical protein
MIGDALYGVTIGRRPANNLIFDNQALPTAKTVWQSQLRQYPRHGM